ncbi:uncharacterized protein NKAPD1 isoform X2 [Scyliorhinus canicula]|nr:uncharacterized protein NKAPD1 isoform X2 [Scyliorhinus canicula]XP_038634560.1 uncharacterized protein NKAPD1 isoform X2 [Scyliorhinus canicula]XP_038634561.1 uncharacterized protein NKAPD1 isoform X2 [Scyliorhinus canicula]XP_038634562.1 uncharacterized protein NKAPD1 isoform X2 [Scyliorhinus canicula]XP_038634563.1 uncharacterized protein NKAPD1 isoform X2 [Scyliorhinus canicula]
MARIPMGKVLLRNVIRHTDAHNKIQEESEMWKIREKEKQTNETRFFQRRRKSVDLPGNRMRCDGYDEEEEERKADAAARKPLTTPQDDREARYWTKKLYEFEASDPNRWGHSGYKELYPEEFESESDQKYSSDGRTANGTKAIRLKSSKSNSRKRKRSSKANKKKRKKKSSKKLRRKKHLRSSDSSSDSESSEEEEDSDHRKRRKLKKKHRRKTAKKQKKVPSVSCESENNSSQCSDSDTTSKDESDPGDRLEKRRKRRKKKHHRNVPKEDGDKEIKNSRRKRKNWKIAHNDTSDDSGEDDLN